MKRDVGLLYICVQKKLLENSKQNLISKKYACYLLANQFHIPQQLRYAILKEMENRGLVVSVNRQVIEIKELNEDLEDTSTIFERVGLW